MTDHEIIVDPTDPGEPKLPKGPPVELNVKTTAWVIAILGIIGIGAGLGFMASTWTGIVVSFALMTVGVIGLLIVATVGRK